MGSYALNIPLQVVERANIDRINEVVSYGVPIAKSDNILSVADIGLTDSENGIPAQFRVLSRYGGQSDNPDLPIRMVLVDFRTDINSGSTKYFYLTDNGTGTATGTPLAKENETHIIVNNGVFELKIKKTDYTNLFDSVIINDLPLISSNLTDGVIVNYQGNDYTSYYSAPTEANIEENGPEKTTILIRGQLHNKSGEPLIPPNGDTPITYSLTYRIHKDQPYAKIDFRIENENFGWTYSPTYPQHHIYINSLRLKTSLNLTTSKHVNSETYSDNFNTGNYQFLQEHQENTDDESGNFIWSATKEQKIESKSILRSNGILSLNDGIKGIKVASRWYWQNWPKSYNITNNILEAYLLPDMEYDHKFLGAAYKTTEMSYCFDKGRCSDDMVLASLQQRLLAVAIADNYSDSNFFGPIAPPNIKSDYTFLKGEKLQVALDTHTKSTLAKYHSKYSTIPAMSGTFDSLRENRPLTWLSGPLIGKRMNSYGWDIFGDMPRGGGYGYSALHYNWDYLSIISFLRFQDYEILELGEQMVKLKSDFGIIHDPGGNDEAGAYDEPYYRGGGRYEADAFMHIGATYASAGAGNSTKGSSHYWLKGIALQYLLTGDERLMDSIKQASDHFKYSFGKGAKSDHSCNIGPCWDVETRHQSRAINNMLAIWKINGDKILLNLAYKVFVNGLLTKEYNNDGGFFDFSSVVLPPTYVWCGDVTNGARCHSHLYYEAIANEPLINLYFELASMDMTQEAKNVYSFLERHAYFMRDKVYTNYTTAKCGTYLDDKYFPYGTQNDINLNTKWTPDISKANGDVYSYHFADLFAFMYTVTKDQNWLDLARAVFKDFWLYPFKSGFYQPVNLTTALPINGFSLMPASAWLKVGYDHDRPMYYLDIEEAQNTEPKPLIMKMRLE